MRLDHDQGIQNSVISLTYKTNLVSSKGLNPAIPEAANVHSDPWYRGYFVACTTGCASTNGFRKICKITFIRYGYLHIY
jgi:hypothetical protein